ncbi:MAG: relaxase/mobilization nuclease domain-containing protein, partial [Clostridia bacterium]|nr:relaxase/mobilization nuclease domain-containing protein [Clostridia bacterium]
ASVDTAYFEMVQTKKQYGKVDGVLAYHYIQSFSPDDNVTPELAHRIGKEFAEECFGDRFQVVIGTHLDKAHLHNHIVVNSVSYKDGGKFRSTPESYYKVIRETSDRLCRENELSVIENPMSKKGMHYAEWKAFTEGKPTIRGQMRKELDEIISHSYTMKEFWRKLNSNGYVVHRKGENIKHTSIIPPFGKRAIRLDSLGKDYTENAIAERIIAARNGIWTVPPSLTVRRYRTRGSLQRAKRIKLKGFKALYFRYLYLFGKIQKKQAPKQVSYYMRGELIKFERYKKQMLFLFDNNIETTQQLEGYKAEAMKKAYSLIEQRKSLYKERTIPEAAENAAARLAELNNLLRALRSDVKMCDAIMVDADRIAQKQKEIEEIQKQQEEVKRDDTKRRSR